MATAAILPKVSATLSICGSAAILTECFYFDRTRLQRVHHRILCLMAIFDILDSPWFFASTWALPSSSGAIYSIGNDATCQAQAFFVRLGMTTNILNASLSWYYLLVIRYSWSEERIREKAAPWMYGIPIILGLGIALAGFPLNLYHPLENRCGIAEDADPPTNHFGTYLYIFVGVPFYFFTLVTVANTALLVWTVWKVESASRKYHSSYYAAAYLRKNNSKVNRSKARKKLQGERKDLQRGVAEMDRLERMVELNRKIEEVRSKKSLQNDTHSVLQLRSKTNEIKNLLTEGQDISSHFNTIATDVTDEEKQNETQQNGLTK